MARKPQIPKGGKGKPAPRTGPRRRLNDAAVERVSEVIRYWSGPPLTWEALTEGIARKERGGWTRQTLAGNKKIAEAYDKRKRELGSGKAKPARDPAIVVLKRDIQERDLEIARLKNILKAYEERFLVMLRNAAIRGVKPDELEQALPPIDRKSI